MSHEKTALAGAALKTPHSKHNDQHIDFQAVNAAALCVLPALLKRWLPDGYIQGNEWIARNPRRADQNAGSFKVNLRNCKWADFATDNRGGDVLSLAAYLNGISYWKAALALMEMLGVVCGHD